MLLLGKYKATKVPPGNKPFDPRGNPKFWNNTWTNWWDMVDHKNYSSGTFILFTRKYPLRGYILGSGAPGTPGVIPKTYGTTFISDIL